MSIHALWCHPRSISTAFERVMRARGDVAALHEPFMYHYYLNRADRLFPDFEPDPGHPRTYRDTRSMVLQRAAQGPVFIKDMAFYVVDDLPGDEVFATAMTHAFLIRDPAEAIVSYAKRDPGFTSTELGFEAQHRLYEALVAAGHNPLVILSDQLRAAPEETMRRYWEHVGLPFAARAFKWDDTMPDGWEAVAGWHTEVLSQHAIQPADPGRDIRAELAVLGRPYTDHDRHHRPFFEALCAVAIDQAHQK